MPSWWYMIDPAYCRGTHVPTNEIQIMRLKPSAIIEQMNVDEDWGDVFLYSESKCKNDRG